MDEIQIFEKLNFIFIDTFDDQTIKINNETSAKDIDQWDSLAQIRLVLAIQKEFNIEFTVNEVTSFQNVGDMINSMKQKGI